MELTIEQALQQGVTAHREGKLQEAERFYRAILQTRPTHPHANHNLGAIAVSLNKPGTALPLFKTALEANPKVEQFWLSYIDALIKEHEFVTAKNVLEQAKKKGVVEDKLWKLESQLLQKIQTENVNSKKLSQALINRLLRYYHNGRLKEAQQLALSITQDFPEHQFAWKVLGAVFRAIGKKAEAVHANQTAVALNPRDAEANSNLGGTLKELGRLEEALAIYTQAIALEPEFAEAHYNLGITLQDLGRLDEAETSYMQAIALKADYPEAHNNLGGTLTELGRFDEAIESFRQAIALKPDYAKAHSNLGNTLQELNRLDEAAASYTQAIAIEPKNYRTHNQLLLCLFLQNKKTEFFAELDYLTRQDQGSAISGSLTCRSTLKYGLEKPNLFCTNPLNYVLHKSLNTLYDFEKIFRNKVISLLNDIQISNRKQILLVNGNQTSGNIFDIRNEATKEIQDIIRFEVEEYKRRFKDSDEGFIKKMPAEYSLHGWFISMKSGGNLKPHIHTEAWLSGSIYINVPRKLKVNSGNLGVAIGKDSDTTNKSRNEKKIIDVVTGSMVLFPASLMHYTIPFESEEERIVLAFDVKEKRSFRGPRGSAKSE